jgi:tetrahydromethanopterin S-methyltransferase subunit E
MFAIVFIAFAGNSWLQHPTLIPAIIFGIVTSGRHSSSCNPHLGSDLLHQRPQILRRQDFEV